MAGQRENTRASGFSPLPTAMSDRSSTPSFAWPGTVLGATLGVGLLDQQVITPLIAVLADGLEVSVPAVGFALSAYAFAASLTALVVGPLSDVRGRRRYLLGAVLVLFGSAAVIAFYPRYGAFLLARIGAGAAGGTIAALAIAWVADLVPYERRGRVMAILMGGAMGAAILGQVVAAFTAGRFGHPAVYAGLALFAVVCAGMLLALPRRPEALSRRNAPPEAPARSPKKGLTQHLAGHLEFLRRPRLRTAALAAFCMSGSLIGVSAYASGWMQQSRGLSLEQVGLLYGAFGAAIFVVQPLSGPLADRFGKRRFTLAASFAVVALTLALPYLSGAALLLVLLAFGCFGVARIAAFAALRSELVEPNRRAAFLAFSNTFSQLGIAAAAALGGALYPFGFSAVCWAMAGFGALAAVFVARVPEPRSAA